MQLKYTDSVSLVLQTKESKKLHTTESKARQNYMLSLSTYHMPGIVLSIFGEICPLIWGLL